jgi:hypothetical protein
MLEYGYRQQHTCGRAGSPPENWVRVTGIWQGLAPKKPSRVIGQRTLRIERVAETATLLMQRFGWELSRYIEDYLPDPPAFLHVLKGRRGLFTREGLVDDRAQAALRITKLPLRAGRGALCQPSFERPLAFPGGLTCEEVFYTNVLI